MQKSKTKSDKQSPPTLTAIRGGKESAEFHTLCHIAWIFVSSCLWNCTQFSTKEKQASLEKIAGYLRLAKNQRRGFLSFCERILAARLYNPPDAGYVTLPSSWLDRHNRKGLSASRHAYIQLKALRESLPLYRYEWKALAEAVLDFGEEPTGDNFRYWKNYFTEKQAPGLLQLFQVYVSNFHFSI